MCFLHSYASPSHERMVAEAIASGGAGYFRDGDGIRRDLRLLAPAKVTILSDRRVLAPYGLGGGKPGKRGRTVLITQAGERDLPGKCSIDLDAGDIISIRSPGGGGLGGQARPTVAMHGEKQEPFG